MTDAGERFGIIINDRVVKTPVAIASMAGIVDAAYVLERQAHAGLAFMGGYAIDAPTMAAAKEIAAGGDRKEFLYDDPVPVLEKELASLASCDVVAGISLRGASSGILCRHCPEIRDKNSIRDRCPLPAGAHGGGRGRGVLPQKPGETRGSD